MPITAAVNHLWDALVFWAKMATPTEKSRLSVERRLCLQVRYECLSDEIKIGDYYLRLLLEEDENEESNAIKRS